MGRGASGQGVPTQSMGTSLRWRASTFKRASVGATGGSPVLPGWHTAAHRAPRYGTRSVRSGRSHAEHGNEPSVKGLNLQTRGDRRVALASHHPNTHTSHTVGTPPRIARRGMGGGASGRGVPTQSSMCLARMRYQFRKACTLKTRHPRPRSHWRQGNQHETISS